MHINVGSYKGAAHIIIVSVSHRPFSESDGIVVDTWVDTVLFIVSNFKWHLWILVKNCYYPVEVLVSLRSEMANFGHVDSAIYGNGKEWEND